MAKRCDRKSSIDPTLRKWSMRSSQHWLSQIGLSQKREHAHSAPAPMKIENTSYAALIRSDACGERSSLQSYPNSAKTNAPIRQFGFYSIKPSPSGFNLLKSSRWIPKCILKNCVLLSANRIKSAGAKSSTASKGAITNSSLQNEKKKFSYLN